MRTALGTTGLVAIVAIAPIVGAAWANERKSGRAIRVEKPRRLEVFVPAGMFTMGLTEESATSAHQQCELAYYPPQGAPKQQTTQGGFTDFCTEYYGELAHMPAREVFLDAYAIDRDEVSVDDYRRCVAAGGCTLDALVAGDERYIHGGWPMVNTTWEEARLYCSWRGARLPTEAEWERAARGDDAAAEWPWGELERLTDFNHGRARAVAMRSIERQVLPVPHKFMGDPDDSDGVTLMAPAGTFPWGESPWGTRDQAGNVAEWTADAYFTDEEHRGYKGLSDANPRRDGGSTGPRVIRGGSWRQPPFVARSTLRDPFNPYYDATQRFSHVGFRCARNLR